MPGIAFVHQIFIQLLQYIMFAFFDNFNTSHMFVLNL